MTSVDRDVAATLLREMLRIRRFEGQCAESYAAGQIHGFLHLYIGEEAVAVGVMPLLRDDDAILSTYREHGHALARGVGMRALMAEMYGKQEGCSRGRGGSMHLFDSARRFYGGSAIVGGALPMAVGFAMADQMQGRDRITVCIFGEGAVAEGAFHESANLAALWRLPVLFLCENNLYAMGTHLERSEADTDLCEKARSYRLEAARCDGMDVLAVREAAARAVAQVRSGQGPCFLECATYRFRAHSMFDPELYRDKAEVERWKGRDPVLRFQEFGESQGWWTAADVDGWRAEVQREVADAVAFAEAGTLEPVHDLLRDVMAPPEARERPIAAGPPVPAAHPSAPDATGGAFA